MTSAIPSIPPLPPLPSVGPADATGAATPTASAQAPAGLGERFRQALADARLVAEQGSHMHGPSAVSQAVAAQDEAFGALTQKIDAFEASSANLSMQEVAAQSLQIQSEITSQMVKIYVGTAVAQGGKGTVQTLMKNQ
ncbi:hypothetical protein WKR88_15185 [Trinickia caryophylli]|uniref:Type III secretion inner rod protein HrpB2 n=1 Tax=Trinickia caryophylli TaxID=28094 RepID=A0A1X7D6J8_TRICW|nr:hypothetical protein [Trinickia caryophylli]PMS12687.1 hypothetical protein C0Z17_07580 [Trinickia caryophylli]TRX15093.1 hypothetical protein FNF07_28255 [Trinickia caryophylli]WQE14952.1 hypothetical protein U0034_20580 [Trinickia caryophylli]SMF09607.1 type III secretion inner rod protein HrpB2 [Trinickia caryophylli]GLU31319.1 hypothetical protein Busp01_11610 [Trinickia caryophylli]